MNRKKGVKSILAVMIAAMLFTGVTAFADGAWNPPGSTGIIINGYSTASGDITVVVCYPGYTTAQIDAAILGQPDADLNSMIAWAGQTTVDSNGRYLFEAAMPPDAPSSNGYTIAVVDWSGPITYNNFLYVKPQDLINGINVMNNAASVADQAEAVSAMKSAIAQHGEFLGMDMTLYNLVADKDAVALKVVNQFKQEGLLTSGGTHAPEAAKRINIASLLEAYQAGAIASIQDYSVYFDKYVEHFGDLYFDFIDTKPDRKISDTGKAAILANISGKGFGTISELQKAFMDQIILCGIRYPKNPVATNVIYFVEKYQSISGLNLARFAELSSSNKSSVAAAIASAGASTFAELQGALDEAINNIPGYSPTKTITVSGGIGQIGGLVDVNVGIEADSKMSTGSFLLNYDPTALTPQSYTVGEAVEDASTMVNLAYSDVATGTKQVKASWMRIEPLNKGGKIITVTFKVNDSVADGAIIPVTASGVILANTTGNAIPYRVLGGEVNAISYLLGDVNQDGVINILDAQAVLRYDARYINLSDKQKLAADVNKDGKIDIFDAMLIQRYDIGLSDTL